MMASGWICSSRARNSALFLIFSGCVMAIPAMKALREHFADAEITLLVRPWVAGLFASAPFVDKVWTEPKPVTLTDWTRTARKIRLGNFDAAVLLPNSFESALMTFLAGVPQRIGYATDGRSWMLTTSLKPSREERHQIYYYLDLVKMLRAEAVQPSIEISATAEERAEARRLLKQGGIPAGTAFLVLNPGAAYGSAKRWYADRFVAVANTLSRELNLAVVMIGSEAEAGIAQQVAARITGVTAVTNGKTSLETLIGILAESSLMITNDSGPMHIAAALGVPTVAVFGPTDEKATGPIGAHTRIVKHAVECSPCLLRECPIDHRCMAGVTVESVCSAARELVGV